MDPWWQKACPAKYLPQTEQGEAVQNSMERGRPSFWLKPSFLGPVLVSSVIMGCTYSARDPEICQYNEERFEQLLKKYCNGPGGNINSDSTSSNVNLIQEEDRLEKVKSRYCSFHWSDSLECVLIWMALLYLMRVAYLRYKDYKEKKKNEKLEGFTWFIARHWELNPQHLHKHLYNQVLIEWHLMLVSGLTWSRWKGGYNIRIRHENRWFLNWQEWT